MVFFVTVHHLALVFPLLGISGLLTLADGGIPVVFKNQLQLKNHKRLTVNKTQYTNETPVMYESCE